MKKINFFNLYEVKCSLRLVFLQYCIRYAEDNPLSTNFWQKKCNILQNNCNNKYLFRVADTVL